MNAAVLRGVPTVREALWAHPEWWVVVLGGIAWVSTVQNGIASWGHTRHHSANLGTEILTWQLMVFAMMLPAIARQARAVAVRSLAERRHQAIVVFLVSYLAPWSVFGLMATAARELAFNRSPWSVAVLCAVATAWAIVPLRERAMMMVHGYAPVIAPDGWRAVWDCIRSGLVVGMYCVASCWPLMLACAASGHNLIVVAAGGAIGLAEARSFRPPTRLVILVSAALTVFFIVR